jgi:sugar O-acyltransferase (sialic acid O-acetyltransferase NeuD family)
MVTKLLILGKGDNNITMILDNLYSHNTRQPDIHVYNNLNLPILNTFEHDRFNIEMFNTVNMDDYDLMALGVYQPSHKIKIVETLNPDKNKFMNIIHDGLDISYTSKLGRGLLINSKVSIAAHTTIGDFVSINRHVSIGHHTNVGDYCSINPGVNIAGNVTIGEGTTIGVGANIIDGVKIGKNSIIGAGSVVTKDIPDNVIAYGNPCKIIRDNETQSI